MKGEAARDDEGVHYAFGIPYRWLPAKAFKSLWNAADDRLFPPKYFGVGWTINFRAVAKRLGFVRPS